MKRQEDRANLCSLLKAGPREVKRAGSAHPFVRGFALFFGAFTLLNVVGGVAVRGFDANVWWIDLRFLPNGLAQGLLFCAGVCLVAFGFHPPQSRWQRR